MANSLTAHQATIIAQEGLRQLRKELVMVKRVNRNYDTEVSAYGKTVQVPKFGTLTANDKTAGSAVTVQDLTSTSVTVTLNKHKESTFILEDIDKALSRGDLLSGYMASAVKALTEKVEDDLFALYAGLSTQIGSAGTDITAALVRTARKKLQDNKAPRTDRTLVLSTKDLNALLAADSQFLIAVQNGGNAQRLEEGIVGRYMGFDVMESQAVPVVSGSPDSTHNLAFHKDAFTLVVRPLTTDIPANMGAVAAIAQDPESGLAIRSVLSYNADKLGVQCTMDMLYGVAELRDEMGIDVLA